MVTNGFKRKNVPQEYLIARKKARSKKSKQDVPVPDDLDWSFVYSNDQLRTITKTSNIAIFCKMQHFKYVAHVTRLGNYYFKKQILFASERKKYSRNRWTKMEK